MLTTTATVLAGLIGAGIILIGALAFVRPQGATGFGIPATPTEDPTFRAWLSVKAVRDIGAGVLIFVVLIGGTPHLLGASILAAALMPAGDALIVLRNNGPKAAAYGVHAATAVAMVAIGAFLLFA